MLSHFILQCLDRDSCIVHFEPWGSESDRINIYERWDTDEAVVSFRTSGASEDTATVPTPDILRADVAKYRVSAFESPLAAASSAGPPVLSASFSAMPGWNVPSRILP